MKFELVSVIVDLIHDHTYLAWGTFWRRDPTEMVMAEDSPLPVLEPLILIFDSLSWLKIFMIPMISLQKKKRKRKKISLFQNLNHHKFLTDLRYRFYYGISFAKTNSTVFLFPQLFFWETLSSIVIVISQFDWLCDMYGCVISPASGIYCVDLGFINNYKEPQ